MLYCTSLIAFVGSGDTPGSSPRRLKLYRGHTKDIICELQFNSSILSIKMNKIRLIVSLLHHIHIYDINTMICLIILPTALESTNNIFALSNGCYELNSKLSNSFSHHHYHSDNREVQQQCNTNINVNINYNNEHIQYPYLAYESNEPGTVILFDYVSLRVLTQITAHKSALVALEFNK